MQYSSKFISFFFLLVSVFIFYSCKDKSKDNNKAKGNALTQVDVLIAQPQPVNNIIEANGTVVENEFKEIRPEVSGRLTYLNIPEGNAVTQGTI